MLRTILLLICSLLLIPVSILYFDKALTPLQWDALNQLLVVYLGIALLCFIVGELTGNVSQVDKLWSIMPIIYAWMMASWGNLDTRLVLMAVLVTLWGMRLTYNFGRRGGYAWLFWQGEEDYRWSVLRKNPLFSSRLAWSSFNLFFICLYQQGLILLFTLPMLLAFEGIGTPLGWIDYGAASMFLLFLVTETIADQQQYQFQTEKHRRLQAGEALGEYSHGFVNSGLWGIVRHPNYACEQLIWLTFYVFSIAASDRPLNWSLAGGLLLLLLFFGSSDFSEKISAEKYPAYRDYMKDVPRFWPFF